MRRLILSACALRFFDTFLLIVPFYTVMFAEKGMKPAQIGVILTAWSLTTLALEVPCGVLADRISRRWLLAAGQAMRCAGFLAWALFPNFWGFLAGMLLWGLKTAALSGTFEAVIYDELKLLGREAQYVRVAGRAQAARAAGVVGASLIAAVAAPLGYESLNLASVVAGLASGAAALLLPEAPRTVATGRWGYLRHLRQGAAEAASLPGVPSLLVFIAGTQAVLLAVADYWQLFARDVGLTKPGIALFVAALSAVGAVSASLAHRLSTLPLRALYLLLVAAGASLVASSVRLSGWSLVGPAVFVGLYWIVDVNTDARFQHLIRPQTRATVGSLKGFAMQCGTSSMMLAFGVLAQASSYSRAFLAAGLVAIAFGGGYALFRIPPGPRPR